MSQAVFRQLASGEKGVDEPQSSLRPVAHGHRDGAVELDHG